MTRKRAFVVSLDEIVVFADTAIEAAFAAHALVTDGALSIREITRRQLSEYGGVYPAVPWDPDRDLTCAEIADAMPR